ncbi:hypothetical protein G7Y89_g9092 [Cudoniella acicularis]|uniref:DUF7820 domain-containing protein n=1 Tax=Cudoniella acicularis TaxID=354080 RepID=A0A8H4W2X8_9HELO|nr:hypothetical protein G7Y89_g9092 [Cudoniella acicularis]
MAANDRRSSTGVDRRASMRLSMQNEPEDDYDLEAMGISDGFRPSGPSTSHNRMLSAADARSPPPRPSSTTKPSALESFALRHDGAMGADSRRNPSIASSANPALTRSSSVSTEMAYVRAESPYQGPAGPSHPYQMYPQESRLARTASMATTSTAPAPIAERTTYLGPSGPTHPYGMYPQNIVPAGESSEAPAPVPVPVGFPGLNNNYQRRLGPDGEEIADIIGPDGHTEQLPPYTQYPDEEFARKTRPNVVLPIPAPVPGAGGIGLATRNPEFASQEDLNSPQSRRSIMSDLSSQHPVNSAGATISEKPELKKWQQIARRKVWKIIPIWVFVLVAIVFILFGIILGTVLAILKPKHPPKHTIKPPGSEPYTTMTTTFDATPLTAVPTSMPAIPTGSYIVPISSPFLLQQSCVVNTAQSNAWACNILAGPQPLQMTISSLPDANALEDNQVILNYGNSSLNTFTYGAQAPLLTHIQPLRLVIDADDASRGPAWWFQTPYDKIVVLRGTDLATPNSKREPDSHPVSAFGSRKGVALPGDNAWICYWNGTILETFIYVNQTSAAGSKASASSSATASTSTTVSSSVPTSSNVQSPGSSYSSQSYGPPLLPFPKVVKIEEHRMSNGPEVVPPYCVSNTIKSDGTAEPNTNSTGQPIIIYLNETESTSFSKRSLFDLEAGVEILDEREVAERDNGSKCGCAWIWS